MPTIGITHLDILRIYAYMAVQWYNADTDLSFDEWIVQTYGDDGIDIALNVT